MSDELNYTTGMQPVADGVSLGGEPGTYRFLRTEEEIMRKDLHIEDASFDGLLDYITARKEELLAIRDAVHLRADTRGVKLSLHVQEHGGHRHGEGPYIPATVIDASAKFSDEYKEVKALMTTHRSPHDLFEKLRDVPHLFNNAAEHVEALKVFRSMHFSLKKLISDTSTDSGEREKRLKLNFEEEPPKVEWEWLAPVYEGQAKIAIPVRAIYEANAEMNGVNIRLVNWRMKSDEKAIAKDMVEGVLTSIKEVLGNAIPVIYLT